MGVGNQSRDSNPLAINVGPHCQAAHPSHVAAEHPGQAFPHLISWNTPLPWVEVGASSDPPVVSSELAISPVDFCLAGWLSHHGCSPGQLGWASFCGVGVKEWPWRLEHCTGSSET